MVDGQEDEPDVIPLRKQPDWRRRLLLAYVVIVTIVEIGIWLWIAYERQLLW